MINQKIGQHIQIVLQKMERSRLKTEEKEILILFLLDINILMMKKMKLIEISKKLKLHKFFIKKMIIIQLKVNFITMKKKKNFLKKEKKNRKIGALKDLTIFLNVLKVKVIYIT